MTDLLASDAKIDIDATREAVDSALEEFLKEKERYAAGSELAPVVRMLLEFANSGGKRIRPLMFLCGWQAAGGAGQPYEVLRAAASLELFHMFALIHDDIMDSSVTRRGRPTVHCALAENSSCRGDVMAAERFGINSAILVGDLALVWSDELLHGSGLTPHQLRLARPLLDAMRTEVMIGQYLDLVRSGDEDFDIDALLTMIRYKTAKYTVERPLHFGAAIAGASDNLMRACTDFALPVGEAFQLRDDLIGVFGDPDVTGKCHLDDLRGGKATALLACATQRADAAQRATLRLLIGNRDLDDSGAAIVRDIFIATGAVATVEAMIRERQRDALAALDLAPFRPAATMTLRELAVAATERTS